MSLIDEAIRRSVHDPPAGAMVKKDHSTSTIPPKQEKTMTPFARMKLAEEEKQTVLFQDFSQFAQDWLEPTGCVQKTMIVLYFRENFEHPKYKYTSAAEDHDIEEALEKWNAAQGPNADCNEFGLFVGLQINAQQEAKVKKEEALEKRKTQVQLIIADHKRRGIKPPLDVLKEAMELGVISVPKATLESMKLLGNRGAQRRRMSALASSSAPSQPHPSNAPKDKVSNKKRSSKYERLGQSMGDLDLKKSVEKMEKETKKSPSSKDKRRSSTYERLGKSVGDLDFHKKSAEKKKSSSSRDKDKKKESSSSSASRRLHMSLGKFSYKVTDETTDERKEEKKKKSSSRLGKSMGDLDYHKKSSSSRSKDKDKHRKSSSSSKDHKDKKSSSKDKKSSSSGKHKDKKSSSKDKEKKSSHHHRKSSRRSSELKE